jgi:serine/threonine protein kinase
MSDSSIGREDTFLPEDGGGKDVLSPGQLLGDYKIIVLLGRGGMGEVYRAENRVTGRQVALKVITREATRGPEFVERFRQEARVMSDLDHPGIVRVHHAGEANGRYYLTMDLVEGGTLEEVWSAECGVRSNAADPAAKLSEEQIRDIALQICDALAYAHEKGIVHRDLKPANILLECGVRNAECGVKTGAPISASAGHKGSSLTSNLYPLPSPRIRITDFGLAKVVGEDFVSEAVKRSVSLTMGRSIGEVPTDMGTRQNRPGYEGTSTGAILGTYEYMSPEQQAGGDVTPQSDLYSFGVILYWLLTGRKPKGRAKPVSFYGVSPEWDPIVDGCLEVDFQDRYTAAEDVKRDLNRVMFPKKDGVRNKSLKAESKRFKQGKVEKDRSVWKRIRNRVGWVGLLGALVLGGWWVLSPEGKGLNEDPWREFEVVDPPEEIMEVEDEVISLPTSTPPPPPSPTPVAVPALRATPVPASVVIPQPTAIVVPPAPPLPTPTPRPRPTSTPVPEPTATPIPRPTPTPVPRPTATPVPREIRRPPAPREGEVAFMFSRPEDSDITIKGARYKMGSQMVIGLEPGAHRFILHIRSGQSERMVHGLLEIPTPRSGGVFGSVFGASPEAGGVLFPAAHLEAALRGRPVRYRIMVLDDQSRPVPAAEYRLSLREIH